MLRRLSRAGVVALVWKPRLAMDDVVVSLLQCEAGVLV